MALVWEEVETGLNRAAIVGGWLVHAYDQRYEQRNDRWEHVLVFGYFVPDPEHKWELKPDSPARANAESEVSK